MGAMEMNVGGIRTVKAVWILIAGRIVILTVGVGLSDMVAAQIAKWRCLLACNFAVRKSICIYLIQKRDLHLIAETGTQRWTWSHVAASICFLIIRVPAAKLPILIYTHIGNRKFFVDHFNYGPQPVFCGPPGNLRRIAELGTIRLRVC